MGPALRDDDLGTTAHAAVETLLAADRVPVPDLSQRLPGVPGLYAVFGDPAAVDLLGVAEGVTTLGLLYVGKAEDSFVKRDLRTHFASGKTGHSTVRRSFAALLREPLGVRAVPRNPAAPGRFANYGLTPEAEAALTEWMSDHLSLSVWQRAGTLPLRQVEREVVRRLDPPLNIEHRSKASRQDLRDARKVLADEARSWTPATTAGAVARP